MSEIKIITEKEEEKKEPEEQDIKETLAKADEYQKLKEQNDKMDVELLRQQEIKAKIAFGGRGEAGQVVKEKTQADIDQEDADKIIKQFDPDA